MTSSDVILIGGGVIGLLTARELNSAGASVTVIDQGNVGQESSWAGGGILLPLYPWRQDKAISALVKQSLLAYPSLAADLKAKSGINPEWNPCGLLMTRIGDIAEAQQWCDEMAINHLAANTDLLSEFNTEPLNPLWLPDIAQIRNPRLIKSLKQDLLLKGVNFVENCQLTEIKQSGGRIDSLNTDKGDFSVNELIITSGAWTSKLMARFFPALASSRPDISPVRGQMLLFAAIPATLTKIVLDDDHYLIPRLDGHILAGSTVEETQSFDKATTAEGRLELADFALNLLPTLKNFPIVKHWAGLRPGSPGGVPYIARHPDIPNLSINAGHFRNGLAMGPASARLMVDLILKRPTAVDPAPYGLNRLQIT